MTSFRRYLVANPWDFESDNDGRAVCSVIGQKPLDGRPVAIWDVPHEDDDFIWSAGITADDKSADSEGQMRQILEKYERILGGKGLSIRENCLRTWIFVRDIDNNYAGVVKGRKEYFDTIALTKETHYIASTGIEGNAADSKVIVTMDAFAVRNIDQSKVRYLSALDHLNPTHEYGVTFERGTAFEHKGHRHIFISGTASIDSRGEVLYQGDVSLQTDRAIENIRALLADSPFPVSFGKEGQAIVYLRYQEDADEVRKALSLAAPDLNYIMVHAPVCRPAWLVEIEYYI